MAPLKFEEKIKEKLEQRAIKPSENSWEKLSTQLDETESHKKGFKKVWWYSIAAIFIGVLILTSIFGNTNTVSDQIDIQYVDQNNEIKEYKNIEIVKNNEVEQDLIEKNESTSEDVVKPFSKEKEVISQKREMAVSSQFKSEDLIHDNDIEKKNYNTTIVKTDENEAVVAKQEEKLPVDSEIIEDKVADIVAQIQDMQNNNVHVTEDEINELLLQAQREITTKKIIKSNTVSASALLQDVESELDETFKERVFEALKTGFQKVKTTVAHRKN
ncbi:hypothetical protein [Aquimarina mytili]|uniref:Uncharacterized protein n=1 Tax=Aquimarina mytili TaxID=874423 RepID=A0A936ZWX6_9FLAO|nr:hypothetical protein [Aquimarina mytili]MBL0683468.1 hypothetical protein [Aquimarina mytili]